MNVWEITKQVIGITFIGFSVFSTSFIVSLFIGLAAIHPVLGPPQELLAYVYIILITSVILAVVNQLSPLVSPRKLYTAPRRQKSYSTQ